MGKGKVVKNMRRFARINIRIVSAILLTAVAIAHGDYAAGSAVTAGTNPRAVAVNPVTNKIYVANGGSNNVTVIDGSGSSTATVTAGTYPHAVAVNPVTNKVYVANPACHTVTVIDGGTTGQPWRPVSVPGRWQ